MDYVLLTADDRADTSFNIRWSVTDADVEDSVTTTLYYDIDTLWNGNEDFIAQATKGRGDLPAQEQTYQYNWDTRTVPAGSYYIWAVVTDGYNTTRWVSETQAPNWPIQGLFATGDKEPLSLESTSVARRGTSFCSLSSV